MRCFQANRRLLRRHPDQYAAIDRGRVIDRDRDFDALGRRVFARVATRPGPHAEGHGEGAGPSRYRRRD